MNKREHCSTNSNKNIQKQKKKKKKKKSLNLSSLASVIKYFIHTVVKMQQDQSHFP